MKSAFGLSSATINTIHAVLKRYPEIEKAVIYGSRAKGNFREGSDIDLTLFGDVGTKTVADVMDALDDSNLPYQFDVSAFELIENEKLREHIGRVGKVFYRKEGHLGDGGRKGWEEKKLGEVCTVIAGQSPEGKYYNSIGKGMPFYQGKKEFGEKFISEPTTWTTEITKESLAGDILMSVRAPVGPVNFSTQRICIGRGLAAIRPGKLIEPDFLFNFLLKHETEIVGNAGAVFPSINKTQIENITLPLPPPSEQKRIVAILDEAFSGIARAKEIAEKNLVNAKAIFIAFLNGCFLNAPNDWKEKKLCELCNIKHGYAFEGEFFATNGEYVLLTPGNFFETGGYRDRGEKQKYYIGEIPRDFILNEGDLLVAMTEQAAGLLGSPILVPEPDKFLHNQRLGLVKPKADVPWQNEFFFHVFNTRAVRQAIHDSASGVKVRHTSPTKIGEVPVRFPASVKLQKNLVSEFNQVSNEARRLESIYQNKIAVLDVLKKSLLHQAFSGALTKGFAS